MFSDPSVRRGTVPAFSGMHPNIGRTGNMMSGLLSQYMNQSYSPSDWRGLLPQGQGNTIPAPPAAQFVPNGPYGQQAMQMAGLLGQPMAPPQMAPPSTAPQPVPGKRPFRPGGK